MGNMKPNLNIIHIDNDSPTTYVICDTTEPYAVTPPRRIVFAFTDSETVLVDYRTAGYWTFMHRRYLEPCFARNPHVLQAMLTKSKLA